MVPTIPLLDRISAALDADLIVEIARTPPESGGRPGLLALQLPVISRCG